MITRKFNLEVYNGWIVVIQTDDIKKVGFKYGFDSSCCDAIVFKRPMKNGVKRYIFAYEGTAQPHIIAHEVVHLVNYIFKDMGIYLDLDNDEPQAYFTGWLTKRINETINKIEKCLQKSSKEN